MRQAVCVALLLLSACAPAGQAAPAAPALTIAAPRGSLATVLEATAAAYTQKTGEAVQVMALGSAAYGGEVNTALLAGLKRYDVVYLPAEDLGHWAAYHAIQPLTGSLTQADLDPWLPNVTMAGQVTGLPTQPDPAVLWYRADLLEAAGLPVPTDWEATRHAAQALATPQHSGLLTARNEIEAALDFAAVLSGYGEAMVGDDYQVHLNEETALRAMETFAGFITPGTEQFTRADVLAALGDGRAAMAIAPFSAGERLLDCGQSPRVCQDGKPLLAWAYVPGQGAETAVGSLGAWAIPVHAAHGEAAQRFLAWLGSAEGARAWQQAGGTPAHRAVLGEQPGDHPLKTVTRYRHAFPPVPNTGQLWKAINTAINEVVTGKQPPEQALQTAAGQMRQALRQADLLVEE